MIFRYLKSKHAETAVHVLWDWIGSRWFWRISIVLFVMQSAYIAFVGRFSMAFDEYYHLGTIQQYAKVWLPWSVQQPGGPASIGSVTTDGSYLYHYLMSFPYRVLEHFVSSQMAQIIVMRLIDVGIVLVGFYVFRRLMRRLGMSLSAAQGLLFVIICLPMTPFLAGQLTYDSLFITLTAVTVLVAVKYLDHICAAHRLPFVYTALLLSLLALTAQVKYAFLPIALAIAVFVCATVTYEVKRGRLDLGGELKDWAGGLRNGTAIVALLLVCVSSFLFVMRYGVNTASYHTPLPKCNAVLNRERCMAYGPYARDDNYKQHNLASNLSAHDKLTYPFSWFNQMMRESYFAVGPMEIHYPTGRPLPVPYTAGYVLAVSSLVLILVRIKTLWNRGINNRLLISAVLVYTLFLFGENARAFLATGVPVAIHGRYMLPLLPLIGYLTYEALRSIKQWKNIRTFVIGAYMILMLLSFYGGGITVFIIRSSEEWYWQTARPFSNTVRAVLGPHILR